MPSVLVIDDDRTTRHLVCRALETTPLAVHEAATAHEGLEAICDHAPDTALLDIMLPDVSGLELFEQIRRADPKLPVIFITSGGSSDTAIEAMKLGAYDYVLKPLNLEHLRSLVLQAVETRRMMSVPVAIASGRSDAPATDLFVGRSPQMQEVYKAIGRVATQDVAVLIRGESGTGKELVARAIYQHGSRANRPFLAVNCAAIPETLLESELFGHEKGSFTGATSRRIGKFEQCSGGTMFLDEVGDMSPILQAKMLRLLQEQRFERVGGTETIATEVRVIAATNRDLEKMVAAGEFRSDLYYRLNGFTIRLAPLRERPDDICVLLEHMLPRFSREMGKDIKGLAPDALHRLMSYPWPGNIRELQSVIRQALLQASGPVLVADFLPDEVRHWRPDGPVKPADDELDELTGIEALIEQGLQNGAVDLYSRALERMERFLLGRVLNATEGNQSQAAKVLGITRGSLRHKLRLLGISIGQVVQIDDESDAVEAAP